MRNNIKRFSVAVLAACGLAVSAALAAPTHQAKLTVQGYDGAELADFPVLVRLSPQTVNFSMCKSVSFIRLQSHIYCIKSNKAAQGVVEENKEKTRRPH